MLKRTHVAAALLPLALLTACGGGSEDEPAPDTAEETTASEWQKKDYEPEPFDGKTVDCEYPTAGEASRAVDAPPTSAPAAGEATALVSTSQGDITVTLDRAGTPCTVNSFVSLAEQGYYDDTPCPRLGAMEGFAILQCGDPSGTGAGGPGYSFADELTGKETYPAGTIAMANAGPDTNGSQFFFIFEDSQFPPNYTVFGTLDKAGLEVLRTVAEAGEDGSHPAGGGKPNKAVDIESVTIS
jgi:peptidyl-prolyl cis-trans isomerase B (cyclophilin B)